MIDWKAEYDAEHERRLADKARIAELEARLAGKWPHTPECRKSPEGSMGGAFDCSCGADSQSDASADPTSSA